MKVEIQNLTKRFGQKTAVDDVSLTLTSGVWGLIGANGAGKTTLMRMLAGILTPHLGPRALRRRGHALAGRGLARYARLPAAATSVFTPSSPSPTTSTICGAQGPGGKTAARER